MLDFLSSKNNSVEYSSILTYSGGPSFPQLRHYHLGEFHVPFGKVDGPRSLQERAGMPIQS